MSLTLKNNNQQFDVILIGAGIMSATLGTLLKLLQPDLKIMIIERLGSVAQESSNAWNNAGTGHSALCELNYTPQSAEGKIDISKAVSIHEAYQLSLQLWAYMVDKKLIGKPSSFIRKLPHMSFVMKKDRDFLRARFDALSKIEGFKGMQWIDDQEAIKKRLPLMMEGRKQSDSIAMTCVEEGTDVNFGVLTAAMIGFLKKQEGVKIRFHHEVQDIIQIEDGNWAITMDNLASARVNKKKLYANFVFIGAGGAALPILEKSDIKEADGYGGFPVSGQWLRCTNPKVIAQHHAKVYGKAAVGAPPMSVPHLDSRYINGKKELLFGPFAGFTTKFLKEGSLLDLPSSITFKNIIPMIMVGLRNFDLTKYLVEQVIQKPEDRLAALKEYYPNADMADWELLVAGQRVQVIKKDKDQGGVLEFGTELVSSADGSIAALLGASPGASTAVDVMIKLIQNCFPDQYTSKKWQKNLKEMIPSFGQKLNENPKMLHQVQSKCFKSLGLN